MAIANNTLNSIYLDSFFQERILDNNGVSVTDINSGLVNLFTKFNEEADNFSEEQRFLVSEFEEGCRLVKDSAVFLTTGVSS